MAYKSNRVYYKCEQCGKEHSQPYCIYIKNEHHFCSKECYNKWKVGENNPAFHSVKHNCDYCHKEILVPVCETKQRNLHFCNKECADKYHAIRMTGKEKVDKVSFHCENCGKELRLSEKDINRKHHAFCSKECRKEGMIKIGAFAKKNNGHWQGGITELRNAIRSCKEYFLWRAKVYERDNWTCKKCNHKGGDIEAHHIVLFEEIMKKYNIQTLEDAINCPEMWNLDNGITLCEPCHEEEHTHEKNKERRAA